MLDSCAIAYLKEFVIAFMLFLIPILTYDANSVIFTFKMKSLVPQMWQENSFFKKFGEIWIWIWKGALSGCQPRSKGILSKSSSGHKESNLKPPHQNAFNHVIKCFKASGGLTGRDQTEEDQRMACTLVNIKPIDNYFTVDLSSICTASNNLNLFYSL